MKIDTIDNGLVEVKFADGVYKIGTTDIDILCTNEITDESFEEFAVHFLKNDVKEFTFMDNLADIGIIRDPKTINLQDFNPFDGDDISILFIEDRDLDQKILIYVSPSLTYWGEDAIVENVVLYSDGNSDEVDCDIGDMIMVAKEMTPQYTDEENEEYDKKVKEEVNRDIFKRLFKDLFVGDIDGDIK